jgi:hypothetical protein
MSRDLEDFTTVGGALGWTFLVLLFGLPVASLLLVLARRWIALVPLIGSFALFAVWILYYATEWFPPVSGATAGLAFLLVLAGWAMLAVASVARRPVEDV